MKINLYDSSFVGDESSVRGRKPTHLEYDRSCQSGEIDLFTNQEMFKIDEGKLGPKKTYVWLFESPDILPMVYNEAHKVLNHCNTIFTYHPRLLQDFPDKCKFVPAMGTWIGTDYAGGPIGMHDKSSHRQCSMLASDKNWTKGHRLRLSTAQKLYTDDLADVWGTSVGRPLDQIIGALAPYRFSIAMENCRCENYFTEKLLNCFAVGTIPIYWGAPNIGDFFNTDGIITLDMERGLDVLNDLTPELYESKLKAVEDNLERVKNYLCPEDIIYQEYFAK